MFKLKGTNANLIVSCMATYGALLENILIIIFMVFKIKWLLTIISGLAVFYIAALAAVFYETITNYDDTTVTFMSKDEEEF